ncbi:MAG: radical SAM protein [Planctomycetota bacterium]|jgi:7-carboxy-7-deazaguanine synthase|nr:radical SAM protein [Planctomycetota bacterium]
MDKTLRVVEIFHSLQGESSRAGRPCAFVRLAGCNLSCAWCDTGYALDPGAGRELSLGLIIEALRPYRAGLAEITGGEPLLQAATPELAARLAREGYEVLVETNGSLDISLIPYPAARIMDLKTPSSGMSARNRLENLAYLRRGDEVKFVIADRGDYEWAGALVRSSFYPAALVTTLLSPAGGRLPPAELAGWMLDDKLAARFNPQLHRLIWPERDRGA